MYHGICHLQVIARLVVHSYLDIVSKMEELFLYCSNDDCATRKEDTPINKEINKLKEKIQQQTAKKLAELAQKRSTSTRRK